jgi:hypothetical protein
MSASFPVVKPYFNSNEVSIARVASAASTNATSVKASPAHVYGWALFNVAASPRYLKIYDKASAPTVGTDTPLFTIAMPATKDTPFDFDLGVPFKLGFAYAITAGAADSDTTAVSANDVHGAIFYN